MGARSVDNSGARLAKVGIDGSIANDGDSMALMVADLRNAKNASRQQMMGRYRGQHR